MKTEAADLSKCWLTFYQLYGVTVQMTALVKELPYVHSPADAVVTFPVVWCESNLVQVGPQYTYGQLYMSIQDRSVEIHIPTRWNLSSHSKTTQLPVLLISSIPLLH